MKQTSLLPRLILLAALLAAAPLTLAGPGHPGHGPGFDAADGRQLAGAVKRLDLDEAQANAIRAVFEASRDDLKANAKASRELRAHIHALLTSGALDEEALAEAARREGELAEERVLLSAQLAADVLAELDDAQRAQLQEMRSERLERRRERFSARRDEG